VLSICVISMSRNHLVLSAPWLAGSALTILLDCFVRDTPSPIQSILFHLPVAMQRHSLTCFAFRCWDNFSTIAGRRCLCTTENDRGGRETESGRHHMVLSYPHRRNESLAVGSHLYNVWQCHTLYTCIKSPNVMNLSTEN
jgi:hypothetical protein